MKAICSIGMYRNSGECSRLEGGGGSPGGCDPVAVGRGQVGGRRLGRGVGIVGWLGVVMVVVR